MPTRQPSYFDKHPDVLKKQYTADEIATLKKNFEANPLKYSQAVGDMLLWRMHQKSPEFASEFAQTPEVADGITPQEAKAMASIYNLIKGLNISPGLFAQKDQLEYDKILIKWRGNSPKESDWSGWIMFMDGFYQSKSGQIMDVRPIDFEGEDKISFDKIIGYSNLRWESKVNKNDSDGIIIDITYPQSHIELYINGGKEFRFTKADVYSGKRLKFEEGLEGILTIEKVNKTNLTLELCAVRDMVLAGEGEHKYSALLEALFWGYMDGKLREGGNPLKNYQGAVEFVKPIWGEMEGGRWNDFDVVAYRLNSPELFDYWVNKSIRYDGPRIGYTKPATTTFKDLAGDCSDVAELGEEMLRRSGYDVIKICTPGHVRGLIEENGLYRVIIDFNPYGNFLGGHSKDLYELTAGSFFQCPPGVEP